MLEISPTPNPTLNLPDSVNKYKSDICWCNRADFTSLCGFELFCRSVVSQGSYQSSSSLKCNTLLLQSKPKLQKCTFSNCAGCFFFFWSRKNILRKQLCEISLYKSKLCTCKSYFVWKGIKDVLSFTASVVQFSWKLQWFVHIGTFFSVLQKCI